MEEANKKFLNDKMQQKENEKYENDRKKQELISTQMR